MTVEIIIASIAVIVAIIGTTISAYMTKNSNKLVEDSNRITRESFEDYKQRHQIEILLHIEEQITNNDVMKKIQTKIAKNTPILEKNNGDIKEVDLIYYLAIFSNLDRLLEMDIVEPIVVDGIFATKILSLNANKEIMKYIKEIQEQQGSGTWRGITQLIEKIHLEEELEARKKLNS